MADVGFTQLTPKKTWLNLGKYLGSISMVLSQKKFRVKEGMSEFFHELNLREF